MYKIGLRLKIIGSDFNISKYMLIRDNVIIDSDCREDIGSRVFSTYKSYFVIEDKCSKYMFLDPSSKMLDDISNNNYRETILRFRNNIKVNNLIELL